MFKYLGINTFYAVLKPFSKMMRKRRMALFLKIMKPTPGIKILDLGGQPTIWDFVDVPLNITCLNLPGIATTAHDSHHQITYVEGNACRMPEFQPDDFDLVFSNSVIEHVGAHDEMRQFAQEVIRLSDTYWIQTPSKYFPLEAHCGMPFWWFYPEKLRAYFFQRWRNKQLIKWTVMVEGTTVVTWRMLKDLLPGCNMRYEWLLMLPKSLVAYAIGQPLADIE